MSQVEMLKKIAEELVLGELEKANPGKTSSIKEELKNEPHEIKRAMRIYSWLRSEYPAKEDYPENSQDRLFRNTEILKNELWRMYEDTFSIIQTMGQELDDLE